MPVYDFSYLTDTQLAWVAGFVDGEGCITTITNGPAGSKHMVCLSVCNTDRAVIDLLKKWFRCGGITTNHQKRRNPNWLDAYTWTVRAKAAGGVISVLLPFLRVKHKQARVALRLRKIVEEGGTLKTKAKLALEIRSHNGRRSVYSRRKRGE